MDSVSRQNGGIFETERKLQVELAGSQQVNVAVLGLADEHSRAAGSGRLRPRIAGGLCSKSRPLSARDTPEIKAAFADTVYFLALLNPEDQWHACARALHREPVAPLVTTEDSY